MGCDITEELWNNERSLCEKKTEGTGERRAVSYLNFVRGRKDSLLCSFVLQANALDYFFVDFVFFSCLLATWQVPSFFISIYYSLTRGGRLSPTSTGQGYDQRTKVSRQSSVLSVPELSP